MPVAIKFGSAHWVPLFIGRCQDSVDTAVVTLVLFTMPAGALFWLRTARRKYPVRSCKIVHLIYLVNIDKRLEVGEYLVSEYKVLMVSGIAVSSLPNLFP